MNVGPSPATTTQRSPLSNPTPSSPPIGSNLPTKSGHRLSNPQTRPKSSKSTDLNSPNIGSPARKQYMDTSPRQSRSPNLNINRWSHSTSSSAGQIDTAFVQQAPGDTISTRLLKSEPLSKMTAPPRSHFDSMRPTEVISTEPLSRKSPNRSRNPRRTSPDANRRYISEDTYDQDASLANTTEMGAGRVQTNENSHLRGTTVLDHSRGSNKYGQAFEGIALQYTTPTSPRQKRPDNVKSGSGLHQATNSSHIGLQKKPARGRHRDRSANASKDTANGSSISSTRSEESRGRGHRSPTQKTMLSQALAKANQAVLLDNAQNIQGAIEAYVEACDILERVMYRSSDIEDRKKLAAIRSTYSTRIAELYDLDHTFEHLMTDKELPEEPFTTGYLDGHDQLSPINPSLDHPSILLDSEEEDLPANAVVIPMRQESLLPQIFGGEEYIGQQLPPHRHTTSNSSNLNVPMDAQFMPSPLAPRRPLSPIDNKDQSTPVATLQPENALGGHKERRMSSESTSWLDTKDEATSESSSRFDSTEISRDDHLVSSIEADLDAVMNAAVNAAYDDEPSFDVTPRPSEAGITPRNFEDTHRLPSHTSHEISSTDSRHNYLTNEPMSEEAEEEERLLDMVLENGIVFEESKQEPNTMSSLPRTSDSSGFSARSSGRTWESSVTAGTNTTQLSTLAESPEMPQGFNDSTKTSQSNPTPDEAEASRQKQVTSLPAVPTSEKSLPLRDRRMSGHGSKQLKIETYVRRPSVPENSDYSQGPIPIIEVPPQQKAVQGLSRSASGTSNSIATQPLTPLPSVHSTDSMTNSPATPGLTYILSKSTVAEDDASSATSDQRRLPSVLRKNTSFSNLRPQNLSLSTHDNNDSPSTPGSAVFQHIPGFRTQSVLNTNLSSFNPNILSSSAIGGPYIFDPIAMPLSPTNPRSADETRMEPLPLEQCPEAYLLRPFWVMRCLYQTLAHPKGGYLSTKLFVPRDIWRVKGVKIKAIDDKIGQCDVLTAALLRLSKVDTLDADAVLEELQQFDTIIETVRVALQKKLGSDVGVTGSLVNIKQSPGGEETEASSSKSGNSSVKSIASNWSRKLRSKSSSTTLAPVINKREKDNSTDHTFPSVPMTRNAAPSTSRSYRSQRHPPPTPTELPYIPPQNANYMSSLARLFDAVQVLDSIARQVEDPGLKATSTTHVGLELSIRGAAEFFSFFVIRFALADIGLFVDKYLKRNSEWAML